MKKTIVIFYSKGYYDQLAISLQEYFSSKKELVNAVLIDEDDYSNFHFASFCRGMYKFSTRNTPVINSLVAFFTKPFYERRIKSSFKEENQKDKNIEENAQTPKNENEPINVTEPNKIDAIEKKTNETIKGIKQRFRQADIIIKRFNPDLIICTTAHSLKKVLKAKERLQSGVLVYSAISDFYAHNGFVLKGVDKYLVSTTYAKQGLIPFGIPEENIEVIGMPSRKGVDREYDKDEVLTSLGVTNKELPNIVLAGGRYGSARIKTALKDVALFSDKANIIILADKSETVHTFAKSFCKSAKINENVYIIDSIDDIAKLYSIADCVVCNATTYLVYEALCREIPVVLTSPVDYREQGNYDFLTTNGYCLVGSDSEKLNSALYTIIQKGPTYDDYKAHIKNIFIKDSSKKFGKYVLDELDKVAVVKNIETKSEEKVEENIEENSKENKND